MRMALIEMVHAHAPTPSVTDRATGDVFINDNIQQRHSRAINMRFYWVRDKFRQGQCIVYWMAGEHNMEEYFTNPHPTRHHWSQRSTYLFPTLYASKYACYMSPIDLQGCVESLPIRWNVQRTDKISLLHGKETHNRQTDTNRPNRQPRYRRR